MIASTPKNHRFLLHEAIFNNKVDVVRKLLDANIDADPRIIEEQDDCGNTPLLLSLKLGFSACSALLLEKGAKVCYLSSEKFPVLDEALLSSRRHDIVMAVFMNMKSEMLQEFEETLNPRLFDAIAKIKDCKLTLTINFINPLSSWLTSLISYFTPSETYTIFKKGDSMRIDYSIRGIRQDWSLKRGRYSLLLRLERGKYKLIDINWNKRKAKDVIYKWISASYSELELNRVIGNMMSDVNEKKEITRFNFRASKIGIKRAKVKTLFGFNTSTFMTGTLTGLPNNESPFAWGFEELPISITNAAANNNDKASEWHCDVWDVSGRIEVSSNSKISSWEAGLQFRDYFGRDIASSDADYSPLLYRCKNRNGEDMNVNLLDGSNGSGNSNDSSISSNSSSSSSSIIYSKSDSSISSNPPPSSSSSSSLSSSSVSSGIKFLYDKTLQAELWMTKDIPLSMSDVVQILDLVGYQNKSCVDFKHVLQGHESICSEGCIAKLVVNLISGLQASFKIDGFSQSPIDDEVFQIPAHFDFRGGD